MFQKLKLFVLILVCSSAIAGQTIPEKKPTEAEEKLRKDAVAFLRETLADVNGMRSLENRISFTADLAGLMWFHDEREARTMYLGAIAEFKDLLARYESRMNELGPAGDDEETPDTAGIPFIYDPSERNRLMRRFGIVIGVRQQMAMSIAEHDPDLALSFYQDTLSMIGNAALRQDMESRQVAMESQLLSQIAANDPDKATKIGKKAIEKGIEYQHIEFLKQIYAKDADKGVEFGQALLSVIKGGKKPSPYIIAGLIGFGGETLEASNKPNGKKPVYRESDLRELAEVLALELLEMDSQLILTADHHIEIVKKYLPGRAAQIRAKFKGVRSASSNVAVNSDYLSDGSPPDYSAISSNSNSNSTSRDAAVLRREERQKAEKQLFDDMQALESKQLPKAERDKFVAQARQVIATTSGRDKKVAALSFLAAQVAKLGDRELASEILRDAERLVNPAPKNYQDFMLSWLLISGYAAADPEKAFPLLEEIIGRTNETLAAFIKVGEFIDVNEDFITDGEVQVGVFGGQMVRGLTNELGMADKTIEVLSKADFAKTKGLTNRFDRAEIRVLAKMMVLRAVLKPSDVVKPGVEAGLERK